jgi:hypothetical protein
MDGIPEEDLAVAMTLYRSPAHVANDLVGIRYGSDMIIVQPDGSYGVPVPMGLDLRPQKFYYVQPLTN